MKRLIKFLKYNIFFLCFYLVLSPVYAEFDLDEIMEFHGLMETRTGYRITKDKDQKAMSVGDLRLKGELFVYLENMELKFTGDCWYDNVKSEMEYKTREAWVFKRLSDYIDVKAGRQILTWGTGDLVFLNDLFPKDWQSFFIGRNDEYLKAPSDSIKISFFTEIFNMDFIYNPVFQADRFIDGTYISYWDSGKKDFAGHDDFNGKIKPDDYFADDEIHLRIYKNIKNYELAFYGYKGFWKSPSGEDSRGKKVFTEMDSAGMSIRGNLGPGIANFEMSYYRSMDDLNGDKDSINNSEMRYLAGYSMDVIKDLNVNIQFYTEEILDYSSYSENHKGSDMRDQYRKLITATIARSLMNQNLKLVFSGYYCLSDEDLYFRPKASYLISDNLMVEAGASIFAGRKNSTFFGQFENNSNIYFALSAYF